MGLIRMLVRAKLKQGGDPLNGREMPGRKPGGQLSGGGPGAVPETKAPGRNESTFQIGGCGAQGGSRAFIVLAPQSGASGLGGVGPPTRRKKNCNEISRGGWGGDERDFPKIKGGAGPMVMGGDDFKSAWPVWIPAVGVIPRGKHREHRSGYVRLPKKPARRGSSWSD